MNTQHVHARIKPSGDGFCILEISPRLALCYKALKKPGKGGRKDRIQCAYFGFDNPEDAQRFAVWVGRTYGGDTTRIKSAIRESDRLVDCAWEVKIWEFEELLPLVLDCAAKSAEPVAAAS